MAKFNLSGTVTVSIYTTVEAETIEEAINIAETRHIENAWLSDSDIQSEECWIVEEFDGEPLNIKGS